MAWSTANVVRVWAGPSPDAPGSVPPAVVLRTAALGHDRAAASLLWTHTSLRWADDAHLPPDELTAAVRTVGALDPAWRAPWVYGALMLEAQGDRAAHEALLAAAVEAQPDEHVFPYMLGMSHLARGDRRGAVPWLEAAAERPDAPRVHAAAAASLRARIAP